MSELLRNTYKCWHIPKNTVTSVLGFSSVSENTKIAFLAWNYSVLHTIISLNYDKSVNDVHITKLYTNFIEGGIKKIIPGKYFTLINTMNGNLYQSQSPKQYNQLSVTDIRDVSLEDNNFLLLSLNETKSLEISVVENAAMSSDQFHSSRKRLGILERIDQQIDSNQEDSLHVIINVPRNTAQLFPQYFEEISDGIYCLIGIDNQLLFANCSPNDEELFDVRPIISFTDRISDIGLIPDLNIIVVYKEAGGIELLEANSDSNASCGVNTFPVQLEAAELDCTPILINDCLIYATSGSVNLTQVTKDDNGILMRDHVRILDLCGVVALHYNKICDTLFCATENNIVYCVDNPMNYCSENQLVKGSKLLNIASKEFKDDSNGFLNEFNTKLILYNNLVEEIQQQKREFSLMKLGLKSLMFPNEKYLLGSVVVNTLYMNILPSGNHLAIEIRLKLCDDFLKKMFELSENWFLTIQISTGYSTKLVRIRKLCPELISSENRIILNVPILEFGKPSFSFHICSVSNWSPVANPLIYSFRLTHNEEDTRDFLMKPLYESLSKAYSLGETLKLMNGDKQTRSEKEFKHSYECTTDELATKIVEVWNLYSSNPEFKHSIGSAIRINKVQDNIIILTTPNLPHYMYLAKQLVLDELVNALRTSKREPSTSEPNNHPQQLETKLPQSMSSSDFQIIQDQLLEELYAFRNKFRLIY